MYSIEESIKHLKRLGYRRNFNVQDGLIIDQDHKEELLPENMVIEEVHRLDVDSSAAGQTVVFAISNVNKDARGILVSAHGYNMSDDTRKVIERMRSN